MSRLGANENISEGCHWLMSLSLRTTALDEGINKMKGLPLSKKKKTLNFQLFQNSRNCDKLYDDSLLALRLYEQVTLKNTSLYC